MKLAAAVAVAAAFVLPAAQAAERTAASPVLGIHYATPNVAQLAWVDPVTLTTLPPPALELGRTWGSWSFSPDRSALAVGTAVWTGSQWRDFKLHFVSVGEMRVVAEVDVPGALASVTWLRPDRLLGIIRGNSPEVAVVDPSRSVVLRTVALSRPVGQVERLPDGLAMLLTSGGSFAPAVLAVVDADGGLRTVTLDRISIGTRRTTDSGYVMMEERSPGLAIDRAHRRAFVVGADLTVAEVNLDTLRVKYHGGKARYLAKANAGSTRQALWLGHDLLAVSGDDRTPSARHPVGLRLVDTRRWKTRIVDRWIDSIERVRGNTVFVASSYSAASWRKDVYGLRGKRRYRIDVSGGWLDAMGPYAYVCEQGIVMRVISAETGRTLSVPRNPRRDCPYLLYGSAL